MTTPEWLTERFEEERPRLRAVAYRILGSAGDAEDAVQEAWLRLSRADRSDVDNLGGWLTTVVGRVALNMLRSRKTRREEPLEDGRPDAGAAEPAAGPDPEAEAELADSVGLALLAVLETLAPVERLAFVLHDLFDVPFDEIAEIVDRSPAAARQLASRARRRIRGVEPSGDDVARRREVVTAFLAASRGGDFGALLELLAPDAELRVDAAALAMGGQQPVRGARAVAEAFSGRARAARLALVDGAPGAVWQYRGEVKVVFAFTVEAGRVTGIELVADAERIAGLDLVTLAEERTAERPRPADRNR